jgi:hypothetical protein
MNLHRLPLYVLTVCALCALPAQGSESGFRPLFNGRDLTGWDGNPATWSVKDGTITGVTQGPESLAYNQFIIWRGGTVKNFELHAKIRQTGNNTGIQYRSKELPAIGRWSVGGYQCDIHSRVSSNGKLYEEQGRTTIAENGQSVVVDPQGVKWLVAEREPVKVDSAEWNDLVVIAQGNHVIHKINGHVTVEVWDYESTARQSEGILALQIHRGPAMTVQAKDIVIKELPDIADEPFKRSSIPVGAKKLETPPAAPTKKGG